MTQFVADANRHQVQEQEIVFTWKCNVSVT